MPNLFVVLVLFIGLFAGNKYGVVFGLAFGLFLDIMVGRGVGFTGIFLAIIGIIGEYFDENFSKDNRIMMIIMAIVCTILFEILSYAYGFIKFGTNFEIGAFVFKLLVECFFNTLIIVIFYNGIKKLGYFIEDNLKGKTFLTRYF